MGEIDRDKEQHYNSIKVHITFNNGDKCRQMHTNPCRWITKPAAF